MLISLLKLTLHLWFDFAYRLVSWGFPHAVLVSLCMLNSQALLTIYVYAALKKEAAGSSEMLIPIDQIIC
jgi:hypothetical protein